MKTLLEILARKSELRTMLEDPKADLSAIEKELRELNDTQSQIEKREKLIKEVGSANNNENFDEGLEQRNQNQPLGSAKILSSYGIGGDTKEDAEARKLAVEKIEKRGADLKAKREVTFEMNEMPELRAVTLAGGTLVSETKYSTKLNETFNQVSAVVDLVNPVPLMGGEAYESGFVVSSGEGDYSTETGEYTETDPVFGYVSIGKAKITAYTELADEALKLTNVDYQERVRKNITIALRKKISKQILIGAAAANSINGIFNAPANVIPTASDITISEIDADTLDTIIFGYGGDEDVEGSGHLILNKKDLAAFAAVRTADGEKLYKIELNGNTGTISSDGSFKVPFIINSACAALSLTGTAANTYCMAYGMLNGYEMPIFSPVTVEESRDFKFKTGQIAYRGSVWAGGNVAMYKGFVRVKKG